MIEATTGVDVDADDEGDDEQEDNDVTFGAEVEAASGSSRLTTLRSSRRRKSTGSASKLPTTSISDRGCFTERKGQKMSLEHQQKSRSRPPRIYDASPIICPSQFHDISNGVEETKTKTNKCHG